MKVATILASVVAIAVLALGAAPAQADTLVVDNDRADCPNADHQSIQAAVLDPRAEAGDTIRVCAGLYTEDVNVAKPRLRLRAHGGNQGRRAGCFDEDPLPPDPARDVIVDGAAYSFNLAADDVELEGFVVTGASYGIVTDPAFSGYEIRDNLGQNNGLAALNLRTDGGNESLVRHNCFRENGRTGMESEAPRILRNARIEHNSTTRNGGTGIDAACGTGGPGAAVREDVTVAHNASLREGFASFTIANSRNSRLSHNSSVASVVGIVAAGGNEALEVIHNAVREARNGMLINAFCSSQPNAALDVSYNRFEHNSNQGILSQPPLSLVGSFLSHNRTSDNGANGIILPNARDNRIERNHSHRNGQDGIRIGRGSTGNRVERNHTNHNGRDGIRAVATAIMNVFAGNHMRKNGEHDAHDDNRPDNVWVNNHCETDFPPGTICER